ncbi:hypothetical protein B0H10DRAFT_2228693 [Mycena sp. CBHHK59/15]|nr:hypothetical protein B0H10DRAFT_2228693 [Mycena sp. CBHHK59/15]
MPSLADEIPSRILFSGQPYSSTSQVSYLGSFFPRLLLLLPSDLAPVRSTMSSTTKLTIVEIRTGKLPTTHPGEITPLVAMQFEHSMLDYATAKDIVAEKVVSLVFGCFLSQRVRNWFSPTSVREAFGKLTLTEFMNKLHKKFLCPDWEIQTRANLLSHCMSDTETFSKWVITLQSLQALLVGTTHAINDQCLRHTLKANMIPDLGRNYAKHKASNAIPKDQFDAWVLAIIELNEEHMYEDEKQKGVISMHLGIPRSSDRTSFGISEGDFNSSQGTLRDEGLPSGFLLLIFPYFTLGVYSASTYCPQTNTCESFTGLS